MNTQLLRGIIASFNIVLILGTLAFGYLTFFRTNPVPRGERVPESFDAVDYQIKEAAVAKRKIDSFRTIWMNLRTPKPVAPPPKVNRGPRPKPVPRIQQSLSRRYDLVMVSLSPEDPALSTCIFELKGGGKQHVLKIGEPIPNSPYVLKDLEAEGDNVRATVEAPGGKREQIPLKNPQKMKK